MIDELLMIWIGIFGIVLGIASGYVVLTMRRLREYPELRQALVLNPCACATFAGVAAAASSRADVVSLTAFALALGSFIAGFVRSISALHKMRAKL